MDESKFAKYEVPFEHASVMLRMLNLGIEDQLPDAVRTEYIRTRIFADRIQYQLSERELIQILLRSDKTPLPTKRAPTVVEMIEQKKIQPGDRIFCTWRNKKNQEATLVGLKQDGRVSLRLLDGTEDYNVSPQFVYMEPVS